MTEQRTDDLRMTTKALQKRHPEVYKKFFTDHDFVCSVPQIMSWGYTASRRVKPQVHMKQKMPTRMYVGVTRTSSGCLEIEGWTLYDSFNDSFVSHGIESVYSPSTVELLYKTLEKYIDEVGINLGIKISILSEFKRGEGFGFSGSLCSLLAIVIQWLHGDLGISNNYNESLLKMIRKRSLSIDLSIFHPENKNSISGLMPYTSLFSGSFPIVQIGDKCYAHDGRGEIYLTQGTVQINTQSIAGFPEIESLSFDYGLIGASLPQYAKQIKKIYIKESVNLTREYFNILLEPHEGARKLPSIASMDDFWQILYEKNIKSVLQVLESSGDYAVNELMNSMYNAGLIYSMIEKEREYITDFYATFDEKKSIKDERIALLPISCTSSQGAHLFVAKKGKSRETIQRVINSLQKKGHTNIHIKYASWRDSGAKDGILIHQSTSAGLFSPYVSIGSLRFTYADGRTLVDDYQTLLKEPYSGFLLDTVGKKIYFQGEKLTSRELKSQTMTVDVLLMLLDRLGDNIHHSELPISGYSKSKNEMVGKIIVPFKKFVLERCGISLNRECHGGLYDFYIRLDPKDAQLFNRIEQVSASQRSYGFLRKKSFQSENVDA